MLRPDLQIIADWIQPGTRVLDLGCGDGALLKFLRDTKQVEGYGLEIDLENITLCLAEGIPVIQSDLDEGLSKYFENCQFDYVIMSKTLQAMYYPDKLLEEMSTIGKEGIVTFSNMGYWSCRLQLMIGKMPITSVLRDEWYSTDDIHLCTMSDFERLCQIKNIHIIEREALNAGYKPSLGSRILPNLLGEIALYRLQAKLAIT